MGIYIQYITRIALVLITLFSISALCYYLSGSILIIRLLNAPEIIKDNISKHSTSLPIALFESISISIVLIIVLINIIKYVYPSGGILLYIIPLLIICLFSIYSLFFDLSTIASFSIQNGIGKFPMFQIEYIYTNAFQYIFRSLFVVEISSIIAVAILYIPLFVYLSINKLK